MGLARAQIGSQLHWIMVELRENDALDLAKARLRGFRLWR